MHKSLTPNLLHTGRLPTQSSPETNGRQFRTTLNSASSLGSRSNSDMSSCSSRSMFWASRTFFSFFSLPLNGESLVFRIQSLARSVSYQNSVSRSLDSMYALSIVDVVTTYDSTSPKFSHSAAVQLRLTRCFKCSNALLHTLVLI